MNQRFASLWAGLRGRCPRCLQGRVRRGLYALQERCPHCQARLERSPGEATGAMMLTLSSVPLPAMLLSMWAYVQFEPPLPLLLLGLIFGTIGGVLIVHYFARGLWLAITHLSGGLWTDEEWTARQPAPRR